MLLHLHAESIGDLLKDFATWLFTALEYIPKWFWSKFLDALGAIVEAIPVPGFISIWAGAIGALPDSVVWWLTLFHVQFGVSVVMASLTARFVLRRIPFIG